MYLRNMVKYYRDLKASIYAFLKWHTIKEKKIFNQLDFLFPHTSVNITQDLLVSLI